MPRNPAPGYVAPTPDPRPPRPELRCMWHRVGVPPHVRPGSFFQPGCPRCAENLAAGRVTGTEPAPPSGREYVKRTHAAKSRLWVMQARAERKEGR